MAEASLATAAGQARAFGGCRRIIIKIGSALLTANGRGLDQTAMAAWAAQIAALQQQGRELVLVSSGAVAEGMCRMNLSERPDSLPDIQACAAIGQMGLIELWSKALLAHGIQTAQVLLTHDDLSDRRRYLNAGEALDRLINWRVIPVINENDTVATDEIRFGDNDTLGAMVAGLVNADLLILLTDQAGMFDADPRKNPDAQLLSTVRAMDERLDAMAGSGGALGRGGMATKVRAARLAAKSGAQTLIAHGNQPDILLRLMQGEPLGTLFTVDNDRLIARKQWLAAHLQTAGRVVLDAGAVQAVRAQRRSLLPVGVQAVEGRFGRGDVVECVDASGERVAVGRINFSSTEVARIQGQPSDQISRILGENASSVLIHRDYMAVF